MSPIQVIAPILIGLVFVTAVGFAPEPARQKFNAVFVAGAGAAYLSSGGVGPWELVFTAAMTFCAYRGLRSYRWIGVAWLLHTCWDIVHAIRGYPILPFAHGSSLGCAICDPVIALWCLAKGPSIPEALRARRHTHHDPAPVSEFRPSAGSA